MIEIMVEEEMEVIEKWKDDEKSIFELLMKACLMYQSEWHQFQI